MPKNNSPARRAQRRTIANGRDDRLRAERAKAQQQQDLNYLAVLRSTAEIVNAEADKLLRERGEDGVGHQLFEAWWIQRTHFCERPATCTLTPRACSALNQNMPPERIVGQDT